MREKLFSYLKLSVVLMAVLVGVQLPSFVDQYGKNLSARLAESTLSIQVFQDDADKYFAGDLNRLVEHYKRRSDPVIADGGSSINALVNRNALLTAAYLEYQQSSFDAIAHVFIHSVEDVREQTWLNYSYSVVLNREAIVSAVVFALAGLIMLDLMGWFVRVIFKRVFHLGRASTI